MTMLYDKASISGKGRITPDGYFVADALVAKANNIQPYYARELGLKDRDPNDVIRVFRPEAEVFSVDSLESAARLPVTMDHPPVMVDASNWQEYARGQTDGQVLRDREFIRVPLRVTDAAAVQSVCTDRQEFSLGYDCNVQFTPGTFLGDAYDAVATDIRYNHLAACRTARGGPQLRIVDERTAPSPDGGIPMPKIVMVDSTPVDVSNPEIAETVVRNLLTARDTATGALDASQLALTTANTTIATRDGEIATLKDQVEASKLSPQALRDAHTRYSQVVDKAKALGATVTDSMDADAVVAAAVRHKLGDKATAYTPEQHAAAFDALEVPAGHRPAPMRDALGTVIGDGLTSLGDVGTEAVKARDQRFARFETAYLGNRPGAAGGAAH